MCLCGKKKEENVAGGSLLLALDGVEVRNRIVFHGNLLSMQKLKSVFSLLIFYFALVKY